MNHFFLAVNSTLITVGALSLKHFQNVFSVFSITIVGIALCIVWYCILCSYRSLNSAKFSVICDLEKSLPISVFTDEWRMLTDVEGDKNYVRLSRVEGVVPWLFSFLYAGISVGYMLFVSR